MALLVLVLVLVLVLGRPARPVPSRKLAVAWSPSRKIRLISSPSRKSHVDQPL